MARLILNSTDLGGDVGATTTVDVIGTNAAETINVVQNGKGTFDGSFSRGNDVINIAGNAASYSIKLVDANHVAITNATGANLVIPVGTGVTVNFLDASGRVLQFNSSNAAVLGTQAITTTATTITAGTTNPPPSGSEIFLEVTRDNLVGTAAADTFIADLVQNQNGEQTNTLGTGDRLNGGGSLGDVLLATIQDASPLNGGPGSSIAPITTSVETVYVTALQAYDGTDEYDAHSEDDISLGVEVNAKSMTGLTDIGSVQSDTSTTFYNVNTLQSGANINDESSARKTGSMTVRMERTGPASPVDDAANLTVLFDNDYLRPEDSTTAGAQLHVQMMDLDAALRDAPTRPLLNNPYTSFIFKVGDQTVSVAIPQDAETYAALLTAFQTALANNPITAGKVTASLGPSFVASDTDTDPGGSATGTEILLTNSGPEVLTAVQFIAANGVPSDLDFHLQTYNAPPGTTDKLITVEVELDKVGRGGDGGYLTIGGMATVDEHYDSSILDNSWKNGAIANPGVEQFNIHVEGSSIEPSSLAGVQSTHNALRVITVDNPNSTAALTIGNSNTRWDASYVNGGEGIGVTTGLNNAVKDVLIFDASKFTATSTVWGYFSDEVVAKYLNTVDAQADSRADNAQGVWTFGSGDNTVNLNISQDNAAYYGAATREDFELDIITGAGKDHVQLQFGDGNDFSYRHAGVSNWYTNAAENAFRYVPGGAAGLAFGNDRYAQMQFNVDTGADNDVVELWGSSIVHAVLGSGDDVIYTDNSGGSYSNSMNDTLVSSGENFATWVFNSLNDQDWSIDHLESQTRVAVTGVNNLGLFVTFQDIESRLVVVGNSAAGGAGATITDLTIGQAVKDAINNDPTLKYLLIAEDGPGGTLIVTSLVDGSHVNTDLQIGLRNTAAVIGTGQSGHIITGAELNTLGFASTTTQFGANSSGYAALGSTSNADGFVLGNTVDDVLTNDDRWYSDFGRSTRGGYLTGQDSPNTNTNVVEGGTGNDIIVLSTNGEQNGLNNESGPGPDGSTETVDINGVFTTVTGQDTILNFTSAVGVLGQREVQTLTFAGTATVAGQVNFAEPPAGNGINYDTFGNNYTIAPVAFAAGDSAATIATAVAAAINAAAGYTLASATGGVVTLTYAPNTGNIPQDSVIITSALAQEQQDIVLTAAGNPAPSDAALTAGTISVLFDSVVKTVTINAGDTADTVGAALASAFGSTYLASYNTTTNTLSLTAPHTGNIDPAIVGISQAAGTASSFALDYDVNTIREGTTVGVTEVSATTVDGVVGLPGYDIFDLTTVMGAPVAANFRNDAPGNGVDPDGATYAEGARVQFATLNGGSIVITDTLDGGDYNAILAGAAPLTELDRISAIAKAADTVATAAISRSIVITVDEDNIGHFYVITNGTAVGDTTTQHLGNIELATYDDPSKSAVGDWDTMTITNFQPLTAENVITTFAIA